MADLNAKVLSRATQFANEIAAIVKQSIAEEVMRLVGGKQVPSTNGRAKAPKSSLAASRAASKKVSDEKVLAAIREAKGGASAIQLAKVIGLRASALAYRLNKLRAAKKVRTTGQRSQMKYFLVA